MDVIFIGGPHLLTVRGIADRKWTDGRLGSSIGGMEQNGNSF
jgi:hypothetical protein